MKPDNSCAQVTAAIYQKCASSVVVVETDLGQHSGFFVDSDIIATDMYYLYGASWVKCYANDSYTPYEVEGYVGVDYDLNLVFLKVNGLTRNPLPFANDAPRLGQTVFAIGGLKGGRAKVTSGAVSEITSEGDVEVYGVTTEMTTETNGGPVVNSLGQVVGMALSVHDEASTDNYAMPSYNLALLQLNQMEFPQSMSDIFLAGAELIDINDESMYQINRYLRNDQRLRLDYMYNGEGVTAFCFTYNMEDVEQKSQRIWLNNYRLVDLVTGDVYYSIHSDLLGNTEQNPRIIYKGTKSKFTVWFDQIPDHVRRFSLMEGECKESEFCIQNINLDDCVQIFDLEVLDDENISEDEGYGTFCFYTRESIGYIEVYVDEVYVGTLTEYFNSPEYSFECSQGGKAMIPLRLPVGQHNYTAKTSDLNWSGTFEVTREGCDGIHFIR
jgi:hypothetical protein